MELQCEFATLRSCIHLNCSICDSDIQVIEELCIVNTCANIRIANGLCRIDGNIVLWSH